MYHLRNYILMRDRNIPKDYTLRYDLDGNLLGKSVTVNNRDNHGLPYGGSTSLPSYAVGRNAHQCAVFNTGNMFISTKIPSPHSNITYSVWINTSMAGNGVLYTTRSQYIFQNGLIVYIEAGKIYAGVGSKNLKHSTLTVNNGNWYHILVEFNNALPPSDQIKIYINGVQNTENTAANNTIGTYSVDPIRIGFSGEYGGYFVGKMQDVRVYPRMLNGNEKYQLLNE